MSSAHNEISLNNTAEKRARQEKRWIFPVVLLFCVLFSAFGVLAAWYLYTPALFSDSEIDRYVGSVYGTSWRLQKKTTVSGRKEDGVLYQYSGEEGSSFSVFSVSVPVYKDGRPTGRWKKALFDNYFATVIEADLKKLEKLSQKIQKNHDISLEIEKTGEDSGLFGAAYTFRIYIDDREQLDAAAKLAARMDELFSFACRDGEPPYSHLRPATPSVRVYLKPEKTGPAADAVSSAAYIAQKGSTLRDPGLTKDWKSAKEREKYRISTIPFTDASSGYRLGREDVFIRLENDYVDKAKTTGKTFYAPSRELRKKYPAPELILINIGGHDLTGYNRANSVYKFIYHRKTGTYWLTGLDPCEDFDGNPYGNYPRRGSFARLVDYLGGSFSCDHWESTWRIGDDRWDASEEIKKTAGDQYHHISFRLFRNGNNTTLDEVPDSFVKTGAVPSARPFSLRDVIRLFNVRITINQDSMTAVMFRDYER